MLSFLSVLRPLLSVLVHYLTEFLLLCNFQGSWLDTMSSRLSSDSLDKLLKLLSKIGVNLAVSIGSLADRLTLWLTSLL